MTVSPECNLARLVRGRLSFDRTAAILDLLEIAPELLAPSGESVPRSVVAMAMNVLLFDDLVKRAPTGGAYVADLQSAGGKVMFDHGALRTIRFAEGPTGGLPSGEEAFTRIFLPLGYALAGLYPLDRLKMTGRAYAHLDLPEAIPQFFLSELHVDRFSPAFGEAAVRVFGDSQDPLSGASNVLLAQLAAEGQADFTLAEAGLPGLVAAFGRHHPIPTVEDYETLLAESSEAAWIATEGSAFNHATDRVADVEAVAEAQRRAGRLIKDEVEISSSGRVRQTAFKADPVERLFHHGERVIARTVPGSFYEFITRDPLPAGGLDLRFDSANAQGIFKMTAAR